MINYNGIELGPILKEDALLLQAIVSSTTPKTLVEFGHYWGESARKLLEVMDNESHLYSFDNTKNASVVDNRFTFYKLSQTDIDKTDIKDIDFVFLDASHDFKLNKETWLKLLPKLSENAIIAVHDTGTWYKGNVFEIPYGHDTDHGYLHCPGEVDFVNWIKENYPDYQQIHFHSTRQIRHGITLLQKYKGL